MDANASLCDICRALIIDDSKHEGIAYCTEDDVQRLLFVGLPPEIEAGTRLNKDNANAKLGVKRLSVPFSRDDVFPDLPCLSESARRGCAFCAMLKSALQSHELPELPARCAVSMMQAQYEWEAEIQDDNEDDWPQNLVLERLSVWVEVDDRIMFQLWFNISCPPGVCATWLNIKRQPLLDYEFWDQGATMLNSWVAETASRLPRRQTNEKKFPTRLIDVEQMRLVITAQHADIFGSSGRRAPAYLALSHCWADSTNILPTKKDNFSQYCDEIPLQAFPAACRDAIRLTRALGFRYLWIDAFCIIQDDRADWASEFSSMADAYANAFLAIAPRRSSNEEGFLPQSRIGARIPFRSAVKPDVRGEYSVSQLLPTSRAETPDAESCPPEEQAAAAFAQALASAPTRLEIGPDALALVAGGRHPPSSPGPDDDDDAQEVDPDDLCPICYLLPSALVRTTCNHAFCASCMARWADGSATRSTNSSITVVPPSRRPVTPPPDDDDDDGSCIEVSCPMCRTRTTATRDYQREYALRDKYANWWAEQRRREEMGEE